MTLDIGQLSVEELLRGLEEADREGETLYIKELVVRFEPLLRKVWKASVSAVDYEDFVQDVFVRLFRFLPQLRNPKAFPGFFRRIVMSVADRHMRKQRLPHDPEPLSTEEVASEVDRHMLGAIFVRSLLDSLPAREQEVLRLEFLEGLTPTEIATRLGLTPGGLRASKYRGLRRLRRVLRQEARSLRDQSKED